MIYLLHIIAIGSALFAALLEKDDFLSKEIKSKTSVSSLFILVGIAVYILFFNYWYSLSLLISSGLIYLVVSLIYLDVFGNKHRLNHFAVLLIMVFILTAISRIPLSNAIYVPITFIFTNQGFTFSLKKLLNNSAKSTENVKQTLELIRVLNGILLLIIGLIFATNRITFLERIAQYLFN